MCSKNSIQNDLSIKNNDDIESCETQGKKSCSIPTTPTPNHHGQNIAVTSVNLSNLHTTLIFPQVGKEYLCFQDVGKTAQAATCIKSRIMTKVIDFVISIDTFKEKCVVLKGMLQ